jgi:hypothetical protein
MNIEIISNTESNPSDTNDAAADTVETVRILGTSSCSSLSGKSALIYNIGMDTEGQTQIQVVGNDGGGYFNNDWITFKDIQAELKQKPHEISSGSLRSLYPSKSNNSPGFLLAVLKAVGLVQVSTTNPRCYPPRRFTMRPMVHLRQSGLRWRRHQRQLQRSRVRRRPGAVRGARVGP